MGGAIQVAFGGAGAIHFVGGGIQSAKCSILQESVLYPIVPCSFHIPEM